MEAPRVGDGGFVGAPSLDLGAQPGWDCPVMPSFWFLYEPLCALGIRSYELESFHQWLHVHRDHRVHLGSDHDDGQPPEFDEITAAPDRIMKLAAEMKRADDNEQQLLAAGTYRDGHYRIACAACDVSLTSEEPERLLAFEAKVLNPGDADMFLERWGPLLTDDQPGTWRLNSAVMSPEQPFIHSLMMFVATHRSYAMKLALSIRKTEVLRKLCV